LYGGLFDVAFRQFRLMPSLDDYYKALHPVESFVWGGIPLVIANML
jgi:hypothetical protein